MILKPYNMNCMEPIILSSGKNRKVMDLGDRIIKRNIRKEEFHNMNFIRSNTSIPIPKIISLQKSNDKWNLTMEKIDGVTLESCLNSLPPEDILSIDEQIYGYILQLRSIKPDNGMMNLGNYIYTNKEANIDECTSSVRDFVSIWIKRSKVCSMTLLEKFKELPPVFSHGDLTPSNIIIKNGKVVSLIDWEYSGFYPYFWDTYVMARYGRFSESWGRRVIARYSNLNEEIKTFDIIERNVDIYG
jgi:aminoglycoside phosphotransferase (APT) family kinase protein